MIIFSAPENDGKANQSYKIPPYPHLPLQVGNQLEEGPGHYDTHNNIHKHIPTITQKLATQHQPESISPPSGYRQG